MKKTILFLLTGIFALSVFVSCKKQKCSDDATAVITGYDQTKGLCGTGFITTIFAKDNVPEKQFIVRELTGDYASQIKIDSKFPIKIRYKGKLDPIENCPNVLSTLEVSKPTVTCTE